jgi:hypothetical protein
VVIPFCQRLEIGPHISPQSRSLFYELRDDKVAAITISPHFVSHFADKRKIQGCDGGQIDVHNSKFPWCCKTDKCCRGQGCLGHRSQQHSSVLLLPLNAPTSFIVMSPILVSTNALLCLLVLLAVLVRFPFYDAISMISDFFPIHWDLHAPIFFVTCSIDTCLRALHRR